MKQEPHIIINNIVLSSSQAMTIRVAISNFENDLIENGLGNDELGKKITGGYLDRIREIEKIMFNK